MNRRRRQLLKGLSMLPGVGLLPAGALAGPVRSSSLIVICDSRFHSSLDFAGGLERDSVLIVDSRQLDIGLAWRGPINTALREGAVSVRGMTLHSDLLVSRIFGREYGLLDVVQRRLPASAAQQPDLFNWEIT